MLYQYIQKFQPRKLEWTSESDHYNIHLRKDVAAATYPS
jgi:ribosomal protein L24E